MEGRQLSLFPFPADLIREVVRGDTELHNPDKERTVQIARSLWYEGMSLEEVRKGARGMALFSTLRKWAYGQARGLVLSDWKAHVLDECYAMNGCFGAPIRSRRVRDCAYSVSVWTWERMIDYGRYRTPELQSRRGRKGGVARAERLSLRDSQWAVMHQPRRPERICPPQRPLYTGDERR